MAGIIDTETMRKLPGVELLTSTKGVKDEIKTPNSKLDIIQTVRTQVTKTVNQAHNIAAETESGTLSHFLTFSQNSIFLIINRVISMDIVVSMNTKECM